MVSAQTSLIALAVIIPVLFITSKTAIGVKIGKFFSTVRYVIAGNVQYSTGQHVARELIFRKSQVEHEYSNDTWQFQSFTDVASTIVNDPKMGWRDYDSHYCFMESEDPKDTENLKHISECIGKHIALTKYGATKKALVVMAPPPAPAQKKTAEEYVQTFTEMIKNLPETREPHGYATERTLFWHDTPLVIHLKTPAAEKRTTAYATGMTLVVEAKKVTPIH